MSLCDVYRRNPLSAIVALLRALYYWLAPHRLHAAPGTCLWLRHGSALCAVSLRDMYYPVGETGEHPSASVADCPIRMIEMANNTVTKRKKAQMVLSGTKMCPVIQKSRKSERFTASSLVPGGGFEPPRDCSHCDLNAARLPIPPLRRVNANTLQRLLKKTNRNGRFFSWRGKKKCVAARDPTGDFAAFYLNTVIYAVF